MTDHDENAAIGELTKRYSDAKRKRTALAASINKIRHSLDGFTRALQRVDGYNLDAASVPRMPADYPEPQAVAELLKDLTAACHEIAYTQKLLKDAGVEVS